MSGDATDALDSIVGSAIRGLVESGADDASIGRFADAHRLKVAQLLGLADTPPTPDLVQVIDTAIRHALLDAGVVKQRQPRGQPSARIPVVIAGRRTSVTISASLMKQLVEHHSADVHAARVAIQSIAKQVPENTENRSEWVAQRVASLLQFHPSPAAEDQGTVN